MIRPPLQDPDLIRTKLAPPRPPAGLVERPRILERLDRSLQHRITVVSAPAGYGKTVAVAGWAQTRPEPLAWLSLEARDDEAWRLLRYLAGALEAAIPGVLPRMVELLRSPGRPDLEQALDVLLSDLGKLESPAILVLDDLHTVRSQATLRVLRRMVENLPTTLRLVVLSRGVPPWPLSRWRTRGWLVEVTTDDLRFDRSESQEFFEAAGVPDLPGKLLDTAVERMEGWPAGLRLLSLSRHRSGGPEEWARLIAQADHLVADYLLTEVLAAEPPEVREFLLHTAVTDRFTPDLAAHLFQEKMNAGRAREILETLKSEDHFVFSIDPAGEWHRYHHLFRDFLVARLEGEASGEELRRIHGRAAEWFARSGLWEEAVAQWTAAGDLDSATRVLDEHLGAIIDRDPSRLALDHLLATFPPGAERERPSLLLARAYVLSVNWDIPGMVETLDGMDLLFEGAPSGNPREWPPHLDPAAGVLRSALAYWSGSPAESLEKAEQAVAGLPEHEWAFARGLGTAYLALSLAIAEGQEAGLRVLEDAIARLPMEETWNLAGYLVVQGVLYLYANDLEGVAGVTERMRSIHEVRPLVGYWMGWAPYLEAVTAYERNDLDAAERGFLAVGEQRYTVGTRLHQSSLIGRYRIAVARRAPRTANRLLREIRAVALEPGDPSSLRLADSLYAHSRIGPGRRMPVIKPPPFDDALSFWLEIPSLTYCEQLVAEGSPGSLEQAFEHCASGARRAEDARNRRQALWFELTGVRALLAMHRRDEARASLSKILAQTQGMGLVRSYLDQGPELLELLEDLGTASGVGREVRRILRAANWSRRSSEPGSYPSPAAPAPGLRVRSRSDLTNREMDVLEFLADRLTNKEIARQLRISPETVRKHTHNLYRKLGVHGRREAVEVARKLEFLE